jgi:hypothetical protein
VSFDIFLQSFKNGEAAPGDPEAACRELEPYLAGAPDGVTRGSVPKTARLMCTASAATPSCSIMLLGR